MAASVSDIWKLLVQSRLLTEAQCQHLNTGFSATPGAATALGKTLAEWLVRKNVLSKYQAVILLSGKDGPFFYGNYKIYDRIDSGRLSGLFRAVHVGTNHPVLLKFLAAGSSPSPQFWQVVRQWIPISAHPNVVRCYDAVDVGSYKFIVLEDLRGQTVAELLEKSKRIPPDEASRLGRMVALGLARLHEGGRVHGDVRSQNLWLEPNGTLKLLVEPDAEVRSFNPQTASAEPEGPSRANHAAPEFLQPGRLADPLTDIYSLGCALYLMIAGRPPFPDGDVNSKMQRHATEAIKPLQSFGAPLTQVIAYAMAKNPAVRFQQATIVAEQLLPFIGNAAQNLKPATPPATQAPYEQWLQQQQPAVPAPGNVVVVGARDAHAHAEHGYAAPIVTPAQSSGPIIASKAISITATMQRRAKAKQRNNLIFLVLSMVAVGGALGAVYYVMNNPTGPSAGKEATGPGESGKETAFAPPSANPPGTNTKAVPGGANSKPANSQPGPATDNVVQDDGQTLWSSPTTGQPIQLKYVPPGAQFFLIAQPAALLAHEEGQRVLKSLGPHFDSLRKAWESTSGVQLDQVEQLIVALYGNQGKLPKAAVVVRLKSGTTPEELQSKWGSPTPVEGLNGVLQQKDWAYYVPPDDKRTFVMGPLDPEFKDASEAGWKQPLLRREIGQLLQVSDNQRHVTILFAPNFLFGDGQELFAGELSRALKPLEWFLGTGLKAGLVSLHLSDNFYFEMRMDSDIQTDRFQLASHVRERMSEIPTKIESYIAELNPHPYWRLVAFRYPAMIRFLHQHTRIGVDGSHAMVNAVLPIQAAHNLVFGGEMVIASAPGVAVAAATGAAKPAGPKSIDELLKAKISIGFAQDSLEFSMQNIVTEAKASHPDMGFDFQIKILGSDLEKDGITRNQQVRDFNHKDKPVAEILTAMVMKANPVTTVKAPNEVDQKLVWVVGPSPDNPSQQIVLITTRTAAGQKNYNLPEVFRAK